MGIGEWVDSMIFRCRNGLCSNEINPNEGLFCISCNESKNKENNNFYEAEEFDEKRSYYFTLFSNKIDAENWVNENPSIRKCKKFNT